MRRLLLLPAVLCATLAVPAAAVAGQIAIVPPDGGDPRTLDLAAFADRLDVRDATYVVRDPNGATRDVVVTAGISLRALLTEAGIELDGFTYLEVPWGDAAALVVRDQAVATEQPPVVWEDAQGIHFLRPSSGEGDVNADDAIDVPPGTPLTLQLRTGDPIDVRIDAAARRVALRKPLEFTVVVEVGERPGLEFEWYFDEGDPYVYGTSRTHRFRRAGVHTILLNVLLGGELVAHETVTVRVAAPPRERPRDRDEPAEEDEEPTGGTTGGAGSGSGTGSSAGGGSGTPATPPARPRRRPAPVAPAADPAGELVSGTLLASAAGSPAGMTADARAARAAGGGIEIPTGAWVALGIAALIAAGWGIGSRWTPPYWQP